MNANSRTKWLAALAALAVAACESDGTSASGSSPSTVTESVTVTCLPEGQSPPAGAWVCPAPLTLSCGEPIPPIYLRDTCVDANHQAEVAGELGVGTHPVRVRREGGAVACETSLTIADRTPPVLTPKTVSLWPPNHALHAIGVSDCVDVRDACEPELTGEFVWASSDEPAEGRGSGNTPEDIVLESCGRVQVRAERQGPRDGRVYKLGVRAVDRAGNVGDGVCTVVVDHDRRGVAGADSGESYRVRFDTADGRAACDGVTLPPLPDAGTSGSDAATPVL